MLELATNAVVHALSPLQVDVTHAGTVVRVAVADVGAARPVPRAARGADVSGRGLALIEAPPWRVDDGGAGKVVWTELDSARVA